MSASASADSTVLSQSKGFFVYIVRCADDSLYVGHTSDVQVRVQVHNDGKGALWTARRRPVVLAYHEPHASEERAISRERQLKRWSHEKKLSLIRGDVQKLKLLAKRRIH